MSGVLGRLLASLPVTVTLNRGERITILLNGDVKMSRGKAAAQAVHAALTAYGVEHGPVIVLGSTRAEIEAQCDVKIRDAGRTEVAPGTLTAGVRRATPEPGVGASEAGSVPAGPAISSPKQTAGTSDYPPSAPNGENAGYRKDGGGHGE